MYTIISSTAIEAIELNLTDKWHHANSSRTQDWQCYTTVYKIENAQLQTIADIFMLLNHRPSVVSSILILGFTHILVKTSNKTEATGTKHVS